MIHNTPPTPVRADLIEWALARPERMMVIPTNMEIRADGNAVMGRGLALAAKNALPGIEKDYAAMLSRFTAFQAQMIGQPSGTPAPMLPEELMAGQLFLTSKAVLLPTKVSWRKKSDLAFVEKAIIALGRLAISLPHLVFGVPMLGTGEDGLEHKAVHDLMYAQLGRLSNVCIVVQPEAVLAHAPAPTAVTPRSVQTRPPERAIPERREAVRAATEFIKNKKILVVSGHRPDKLGGYGAANFETLVNYCLGHVRDVNPEVVVHGGALGTDMAFAEAARRLGIPTLYAEPCAEQDAKWFDASKKAAQVNRDYARDSGLHVLVDPRPYSQAHGCMQARNEFIVRLLRNSGEGSGFMYMHNGTSGGTANCISAFGKIVPTEVQIEMDLGNIYPGWKQLQSAQFSGLKAA